MAKRRIDPDSKQPSLFVKEESRSQEQNVCSFSRLAAVFEDDARIRASFSSKEEYYLSPQWRYKRLEKLRLVNNRCERCGRSGALDVHHLNYNSLYNEKMEDLLVVCRSCHKRADGEREHNSAYSSYLATKYGEEGWKHDSEYEYEQFSDWLDSKCDDW